MVQDAGQPLIGGLPRDEWRKRYVDTLGTTISYFLALSTATIAFCAAQISKPHGANELRACFQIAAGLLGVSVALGIACSIRRLFIFRERGKLPESGNEAKKLHKSAHDLVLGLVVLQVLFFLVGIVTVAIKVFVLP